MISEHQEQTQHAINRAVEAAVSRERQQTQHAINRAVEAAVSRERQQRQHAINRAVEAAVQRERQRYARDYEAFRQTELSRYVVFNKFMSCRQQHNIQSRYLT